MARKENKKDLILRKSFQLFVARGFDGVSFTDIERETQLTRGGIFHYFNGKEDLFKQVADLFVLSFLQEVEYDKGYQKSSTPLMDFMKTYLEVIEKRMERFTNEIHPDVSPARFLAFILYLKDHYDEWAEKVQIYENQTIQDWVEVIELSKTKGEIKSNVDAFLLAETFHHLYLGLSFGGAVIDKLSLTKLDELWQFVYKCQLA